MVGCMLCKMLLLNVGLEVGLVEGSFEELEIGSIDGITEGSMEGIERVADVVPLSALEGNDGGIVAIAGEFCIVGLELAVSGVY